MIFNLFPVFPSHTGIAFPTCLSLNNCICHNSPLESEPEVKLKTGDLVKM